MNPLADLNKKNKQTGNCSISLAYITTYDCVFIHIYSTCLQACDPSQERDVDSHTCA